MQINSINSTNLYNKASFNGLWGKTSMDSDVDDALCIPSVVTTYYYYPYNNEPDDFVRSFEKSIESAEIRNDEEGNTKCYIEDCKICARLPFDENDFEKYRRFGEKSQLSDLIKNIHTISMDKFVNRTYGPTQIRAFNPAVENKIKEEEEAKRIY